MLFYISWSLKSSQKVPSKQRIDGNKGVSQVGGKGGNLFWAKGQQMQMQQEMQWECAWCVPGISVTPVWLKEWVSGRMVRYKVKAVEEVQIRQGCQSHCKDLAVNLHEIGINHHEIGVHWKPLRKKVIYCLKDYSGWFVEERMETSSRESGRSKISQKGLKSFQRGMMVPREMMIVLDIYYFGTSTPNFSGLCNNHFIICHIFVDQGYGQGPPLGNSAL